MSGKGTDLTFNIIAVDRASGAFDKVGASAAKTGVGVEKAAKAADGMATKASTATGALGALAGGFEMVGLEKYATGLQGAAVATDFMSGVGDSLTLVLESQAVTTAKARLATVAKTVAEHVAAGAAKALAAAQWLVNAAMTANPIGIVVVALVALVAALVIAYQKSETFRDIVNGALGAVSAAFAGLKDGAIAVLEGIRDGWIDFKDRLIGIKDSIGQVIGNLFDPARGAWTAVKDWLEGKWADFKGYVGGWKGALTDKLNSLFNPMQGAWTAAKEWVEEKWGAFKGWIDGWKGALTGKLSDIFGGIRDAWTTVKGWVEEKWADFKTWMGGLSLNFNGLFDGLLAAFKAPVNAIIAAWNGLSFGIPAIDPPGPGSFPGVTIHTPNIPFLAEGGIVRKPTLAVVGEAGPEAVIPLSKMPATRTASIDSARTDALLERVVVLLERIERTQVKDGAELRLTGGESAGRRAYLRGGTR